jgi:hypothetical protein
MPQAWHDFLLLTGTAAATLLGLVFVAASIAATIPNEKLGDATTGNLWVQPIVWAFVRVLMVCAIGVVPGQSTALFGKELAGLALTDLARMVWLTAGLRKFHRTKEALTFEDWRWYAGYPLLATLALLTSGASLAMDWGWPGQLLAVGILGHLIVGVHNAWELAAWLATRQ